MRVSGHSLPEGGSRKDGVSDLVSQVAWEHLGIPPEELDNVAKEREVQMAQVTMNQLLISSRTCMDG